MHTCPREAAAACDLGQEERCVGTNAPTPAVVVVTELSTWFEGGESSVSAVLLLGLVVLQGAANFELLAALQRVLHPVLALLAL